MLPIDNADSDVQQDVDLSTEDPANIATNNNPISSPPLHIQEDPSIQVHIPGSLQMDKFQ